MLRVGPPGARPRVRGHALGIPCKHLRQWPLVLSGGRSGFRPRLELAGSRIDVAGIAGRNLLQHARDGPVDDLVSCLLHRIIGIVPVLLQGRRLGHPCPGGASQPASASPAIVFRSVAPAAINSSTSVRLNNAVTTFSSSSCADAPATSPRAR